MKVITLEDFLDKLIGVKGTEKRDKFEKSVSKEIKKQDIKKQKSK